MTPAEKLLILKKEHAKDAQWTILAFCDVMESPFATRFNFGRLSSWSFFESATAADDAAQIEAVYNALLTRRLTR